jgi:hypothetical protein
MPGCSHGLGANKSGPSDLRNIVLTFWILCARVFVVVFANSTGELALIGPQPRSLSRSRRSTTNFPRWNTAMVWQRRRQSHMKGGTHGDHELPSNLSHVLAITFITGRTRNPRHNRKSVRVSACFFLNCARYLLPIIERYNPNLY